MSGGLSAFDNSSYRTDSRGEEAAAHTARLLERVESVAARRELRTHAGYVGLATAIVTVLVHARVSDSPRESPLFALLDAALPLLAIAFVGRPIARSVGRSRNTLHPKLVHDAREERAIPFDAIRDALDSASEARISGTYALAYVVLFVVCTLALAVVGICAPVASGASAVCGGAFFHLVMGKRGTPDHDRFAASVIFGFLFLLFGAGALVGIAGARPLLLAIFPVAIAIRFVVVRAVDREDAILSAIEPELFALGAPPREPKVLEPNFRCLDDGFVPPPTTLVRS